MIFKYITLLTIGVRQFTWHVIICGILLLLFVKHGKPRDRDYSLLNSGCALNLSPENIKLNFEDIGLQYRDINAMLNDIRQMDSCNSLAEAACKYVIKNSFHCVPVTENNWLHHPEIFINSVGFGYCDDRASVLAALWNALGFEARIWGLNGHVVPEVNDGGNWKIFDPDMACSFVDGHDQVASYQDLTSDAPFRFKSYHFRNTIKFFNEEKKIDSLRLLYTSVEDNADITEGCLSFRKNMSKIIVLPPQAELKFIQSDSYYINEGLPVKNFIEITLLPGSEGVLYLPLLPLGCEGNFTFQKSEQKFSITRDFTFNYDSLSQIDSFLIMGVKDTSIIYFLANGIKPADSSSCEYLHIAHKDLKAIMKPKGKGNWLNIFATIHEIPDTTFLKLEEYRSHLDSLDFKIKSQDDFNDALLNFMEKVCSRKLRYDTNFTAFMTRGYQEINQDGELPPDKWSPSVITSLFYMSNLNCP